MRRGMLAVQTCLVLAGAGLGAAARGPREQMDAALAETLTSLPDRWALLAGSRRLVDIMGVRLSFGPALEDRTLERPTSLQRWSAESWREVAGPGYRRYETRLSLGLLRGAASLFLFEFQPGRPLESVADGSLEEAAFPLNVTVASAGDSCVLRLDVGLLTGKLSVVQHGPGILTGLLFRLAALLTGSEYPSFTQDILFPDFPLLIADHLAAPLDKAYCHNQ